MIYQITENSNYGLKSSYMYLVWMLTLVSFLTHFKTDLRNLVLAPSKLAKPILLFEKKNP